MNFKLSEFVITGTQISLEVADMMNIPIWPYEKSRPIKTWILNKLK